MSDVTREDAEKLVDRFAAELMNPIRLGRGGGTALCNARDALIAALTRPAPQPSDVEAVDAFERAVRNVSQGIQRATLRDEVPLEVADVERARAVLLARLDAGRVPEGAGTVIAAGHVKFPESREEADAMILVAEAWIKAHRLPAAPSPEVKK